MLYRITAVTAVFCIILALTGGCGGGSGSPNLQPVSPESATGALPPGVEITVQQAEWGRKAAGIKREIHFSYALAGYPAEQGFTAVAMADDLTPCDSNAKQFGISVNSEDPERVEVRLAATGQRQVMTHLWFDSAKWELDGVISKNPWPTKDFIALPILKQDGVLQIASIPVGKDTAVEATGDFAQVFFVPAGTSRQVSGAPDLYLTTRGPK